MIQITTGGYRCTIPECDGSKAKVTDFDTSMELFNATVGSCARPVLSNSSNKNKIYLYNCSTIRPEMVNDVVECRSSQDSFLYAPFEFDSTVVSDFNAPLLDYRMVFFLHGDNSFYRSVTRSFCIDWN